MNLSAVSGRKVAAINCGTNSIRLLIAQTDDRGTLLELDRPVLRPDRASTEAEGRPPTGD